jgi:hypothetical protein
LTLVLVPKDFPLVRSLWKPMSVLNVTEARKALGQRECSQHSHPKSCVDYWPRGSKNKFVARQVGTWAKVMSLDAVLWTNLAPKFNDRERTTPTEEEVVTYLRALQGEKREKAEEYIRKAPRQIDTKYRRRVEKEFGWTCQSVI